MMDRDNNNALDIFIDKYAKTMPDLSRWAETNIPEGLRVFSLDLGELRLLDDRWEFTEESLPDLLPRHFRSLFMKVLFCQILLELCKGLRLI